MRSGISFQCFFIACGAAAAEKLIKWTPSVADEIILWVKEPFDVNKAAKRARSVGFDVELRLENRIRVFASDWPGFRPRFVHGKFGIDCSTDSDSECKVQTGSLPWGKDADWMS